MITTPGSSLFSLRLSGLEGTLHGSLDLPRLTEPREIPRRRSSVAAGHSRQRHGPEPVGRAGTRTSVALALSVLQGTEVARERTFYFPKLQDWGSP